MADVRKRRRRLAVVTVVVFLAISIAGALLGKALGLQPFVSTAVTAPVAVTFVFLMTYRMRKLK